MMPRIVTLQRPQSGSLGGRRLLDQLREDLVVGRTPLARRLDCRTGLGDDIEDEWHGDARILDDDPHASGARAACTARTPSTSWRASTSNVPEVSISMTSPPVALRRSASGVSRATSRPPAIRATRSHDSASVTYCVVTRSVRPSSRRRRSSVHTWARSSGSMPTVGSSRMRSSGSWTSADPRATRRCCPPDRLCATRLRTGVRSINSRTSFTRRLRAPHSMPKRLAARSMFSPAVRSG